MTEINGMAYYEVDFNADGNLNTATGGGDGGLPAAVAAGGITDLFVLSHGWNNGVDSARDLYQAMFGLLAGQLGNHLSSSAAVGIIWPSLLFPDDDPATAPPVPSTGAQLATALAPAFPGQQQQLATMGQLLDQQPQDPAKLIEFHQLAAGLVTTPPGRASKTPGKPRCSPPTPRRRSGMRRRWRRMPPPARRASAIRSPGCGPAGVKCYAR